MELLSKMNDNICALGVSLNKRKHESIVSDQPSTNMAVSAKKAKTSSLSESVSDNESDSEALLGNAEQGHHNGNENTSNEDEQQPANMADVDDPLLDEIAQSLDETERTGDPVSDKLALIANKRWNHKLSDDQLKEKAEKYPRPANCDKVVSPRVNPEIWAKLPRAVRGEDHKLFRVQTQLSTVTNLVVQATDMLLKEKSDPKSLQIDDLVRMNTDSVALVSHASHELAQRRREIIKPHLHRDYIELCSQEVPVTSLLFGDDLQTELTRIRATNKIGNTTNPSSHAPSQRRIYKPNTSNYGNSLLARSPVVQTTGEQQQAGSEPSSFRANKEIDSEAIHKLSQIQVSEYESLVPSQHKVANFKAGQLSTSYFAWNELTSDPEILETVSGQRIEFNQNPVQLNLPVQPNYSCQQGQFIDSEIQSLLKKGVIVESTHEPNEYISPIFLRPKKDG